MDRSDWSAHLGWETIFGWIAARSQPKRGTHTKTIFVCEKSISLGAMPFPLRFFNTRNAHEKRKSKPSQPSRKGALRGCVMHFIHLLTLFVEQTTWTRAGLGGVCLIVGYFGYKFPIFVGPWSLSLSIVTLLRRTEHVLHVRLIPSCFNKNPFLSFFGRFERI